jgi:tetratricopeptide (TPR) repeat protein
MIASVLSMRANAAWSTRDVRRCIALSEAACRITDTSPGVRALSVQQLARGYALAGDRVRCERALDEAFRLSALAGEEPDREPPWIYYQTPLRLEIQRGMCYRDLGAHRKAIDVLVQAIAQLPLTYRRDRGQYLARVAVAFAQAGDLKQAAAAAEEARQLAAATGSARTVTELSRLPQVA